ncbi:hypothetical protein NL676_018632 [Syzygium grande]|nr:hypothetical protein NL676_018632 [Syzygium grande]
MNAVNNFAVTAKPSGAKLTSIQALYEELAGVHGCGHGNRSGPAVGVVQPRSGPDLRQHSSPGSYMRFAAVTMVTLTSNSPRDNLRKTIL